MPKPDRFKLYNFMQANYPIHGSTSVLGYAVRYYRGDPNVWTCADWSNALNDMFQSLNLQYWQTNVENLFGIHSIVVATYAWELPRVYDPWFMAPFLYNFAVFPPLPPR